MKNLKTPDKIIILLIIASLIFIIIGHKYRDRIQNVLKKPIVHINEFNLDWWSVSHFSLFAIFGFLKPGYPLSFFTMGVIFEAFEDGLSSDQNTKLVDCLNKRKPLSKIFCRGIEDSYWYAKIDDIAVNLLGYIVGQAIRTTFFKNLNL